MPSKGSTADRGYDHKHQKLRKAETYEGAMVLIAGALSRSIFNKHTRRQSPPFDLDCPPYVPARNGVGTILELASRASDAASRYRATIDARADFDATLRAAGALARATHALTTAITDAVASGDNRLS